MDEQQQQSATPAAPAAKGRGRVVQVVMMLVMLGMVGGGGYVWWSGRNQASTDDAFLDGHAASIAPQVSGTVLSLDVGDNAFVHKGDPLIHIDPRAYEIARAQAQANLDNVTALVAAQRQARAIARKNFPAMLEQAQAQLANAKATLVKAEADYRRQRSLPALATTQQDADTVQANLQQARAQVQLAEAQVRQAEPVTERIEQVEAQLSQSEGQLAEARAQLDQANLNLAWTVVTAPTDGWITKRAVEAGAWVSPGQVLLSIVSPDLWVTANFKEDQLTRMRPGQKVAIRVDAYGALMLAGHVESIQRGTGAKFTAFPPENATGNFVKIVQRVPVRIAIDQGLDSTLALPLGLSVVPTVTLQ